MGRKAEFDKVYAATFDPNRRTNRTKPITAADLMDMEFEPTRWVVPDVLPEGLSLLVGKPKKGKSWMALGMCEAVAVGGVALGTKRVDRGDTLYLALEDNKKRLQKRLRKVLDGRRAPETMHLHTQWPRLDEGGADQLDEWLTEHPEARLVVIDTLAKIRKPARGANVYTEDYSALELLLPLAAKHGVAIVVVHHLRKMAASDPMDEISSSTGLTAGVDGFLILRRTQGSKGPTLYVDGRDIEEPTEYALHWNLNTATWTIEGEAEEVHLSKERGDILLVLNRNPEPMTPKEVTDALGGEAKYNNIKQLMFTMLGDGQLIKDSKGRYSPANPTNPGNPGNAGNLGNPGNPTASGYAGYRGGNPTGNPNNRRESDTYVENESRVTAVTGVTGECLHGVTGGCWLCNKSGRAEEA
jgi:AAA domain